MTVTHPLKLRKCGAGEADHYLNTNYGSRQDGVYIRRGKRTLDLVAGSVITVVATPVALVAALAVYVEDRGPILFHQTRVGQHGQPIRIAKIRSMPVGTPEVASDTASTLPLTRVGRVLRRTNIDELPQLISVLAGDLSLVGPRPALYSQTELVKLRRANGSIHLRPGLTGLAQVNGYDGMPVPEKAGWDGRYARHLGLRSDLVILARTLPYLARRPAVY